MISNIAYVNSCQKAKDCSIVLAIGNSLQSYIRHLLWALSWSVPKWNLRHQFANRYKRQACSCGKCYRRLTILENQASIDFPMEWLLCTPNSGSAHRALRVRLISS